MRWPWKKREPVATNKYALWIIQSLRDRPEDWSLSIYTLRHVSGAKVWVSNNSWAVDLTEPGGVVVWRHSDPINPSDDHKAVWAAYQAWARDRAEAAGSRFLSKVGVWSDVDGAA